MAVLGELDSLRVADHPYANPETGAAHACGHHTQIGSMVGATMGLLADGVLPELSGSVVPFAVPAEEFIELEDRLRLQAEGKLEFLSGKQELIRIGAFDDVDLAMMVHSTSRSGDRLLAVGGTNNGHLVKQAQFIGKAAHAGGAPHLGINALNAANVALHAIHALRETFPHDDMIRVHGIITKGGEVVNAVPADVRLELRVRGASLDAVDAISKKVDRCLRAGALAVGGKVRIRTLPGYLPLKHNPIMQELFQANAERLVGKEQVAVHSPRRNSGGFTDMGDLGYLMPVLHPYAGGASGAGHGPDYIVRDYEAAVINPAKAMAMTVIDLLAERARKAHEALRNYPPRMSKERYVAFQRSREMDYTFDESDGIL